LGGFLSDIEGEEATRKTQEIEMYREREEGGNEQRRERKREEKREEEERKDESIGFNLGISKQKNILPSVQKESAYLSKKRKEIGEWTKNVYEGIQKSIKNQKISGKDGKVFEKKAK